MTYEGIIGLDPPDHTRLRKLAGKALTARRVNGIREDAQRIANEYVDDMIAKGSPGDLVEMFALPFPITVICELLGVPFEDRAQFRIWTEGADQHQRAAHDLRRAVVRLHGQPRRPAP